MYDLSFVLTWCSLQDPVKPSEHQNCKSSKCFVLFSLCFGMYTLKIMTWKKMGPNPIMFNLFLTVKHNNVLNIRFQGPMIWNSIDEDFKRSSLSLFKLKLKEHLTDNY